MKGSIYLEMNKLVQKNLSFEGIEMEAKQDDDGYKTVYKMNYPDGHGLMTSYAVLPGVQLIFNDFDVENCFCGIQTCDNIMEINYCSDGRSECELQNGSYRYMGQGDFCVNILSNHAIKMGFPLKSYKGITIMLYLNEAASAIPKILHDDAVNIYKLKEKFCKNDECFIMRSKDEIEHIFSGLYSVPVSIQKLYFKLKVLELLLFLGTIDVSKNKEKREYYPKKQVEIIKQIKSEIIMNPKRHYTIEELAKKHGISRTALKSCFKGVYGKTIAAYTRLFRMQYAAVMLQDTNKSVSDIAAEVGYENQSRFAAAFKEIMGTSPLNYRKSNCPI